MLPNHFLLFIHIKYATCWMVGRLLCELFSLILKNKSYAGTSRFQLCAEPGAWQGHIVMSRITAGAHYGGKKWANRHSGEWDWRKGWEENSGLLKQHSTWDIERRSQKEIIFCFSVFVFWDRVLLCSSSLLQDPPSSSALQCWDDRYRPYPQGKCLWSRCWVSNVREEFKAEGSLW